MVYCANRGLHMGFGTGDVAEGVGAAAGTSLAI